MTESCTITFVPITCWSMGQMCLFFFDFYMGAATAGKTAEMEWLQELLAATTADPVQTV
jgi:hypothetical protein